MSMGQPGERANDRLHSIRRRRRFKKSDDGGLETSPGKKAHTTAILLTRNIKQLPYKIEIEVTKEAVKDIYLSLLSWHIIPSPEDSIRFVLHLCMNQVKEAYRPREFIFVCLRLLSQGNPPNAELAPLEPCPPSYETSKRHRANEGG
jgi:hypothetical protein